MGHLAGRLHPATLVRARQQSTREWWANEGPRYAVYVSELVVSECSGGDPTAAAERLAVIEEVDRLEQAFEVDQLADRLMQLKAVPTSEPRDAHHVAMAAVHGIDYLLTWNFRHIANASLRRRIETVCRDAGYEPALICTPDELKRTTDAR